MSLGKPEEMDGWMNEWTHHHIYKKINETEGVMEI